jgi:hypothetical protein
MHGGE